MVGKFDKRRVYVTGGSSGIGAAVAAAMAAEGAHVAIGASRRADQAEAAAAALRSQGWRAVVVKANLANRAETDRAADEVLRELGGLDIFVHCAGIDVTQTNPTHATPDETWDQMLSIHLTAAFRLSKRLLPALLHGERPSVTFVGSVAGLVAWEGDVAYNVAKAGLHHLARCIAADYAKQGLRANAIAPGVIDTPLTRGYASGMEGGEEAGMKVLSGLHPIGRYATPDEVAATVLFLSSDQAGFITGAILPVDGGMTMI
ncbi:SDR family NAD(P)-dependent oxidoreductase [Aestuariivirga sp.]|jgi:NAD(P)-dependent dehydrogenase (short-subunit alcohol dehydrogenase family)|uniref:SDR family NAD(P)-dependent oxidoreductase n=1 Tax=Aestuariivirga sp. TaxID=2650926 RepID=UPI0037836773